MSTEPESFLARWARRKREAERKVESPAEIAAPPMPAALPAQVGDGEVASRASASATAQPGDPAPATEVPLPTIDSLDGVRSDYQAFFQHPVSDDLRRAALKKLFADPHFNQMDMLDVYVDDYTQFEPLPAAMRLRLPSARDFLLDSERAALDAAEATSGAAPQAVLATSDTNVGTTSAPTIEPNAEPTNLASPDDATEVPDLSTLPAVPPDKARSPDSTSN
jgi:Protein of unknown function (DUF3306)